MQDVCRYGVQRKGTHRGECRLKPVRYICQYGDRLPNGNCPRKPKTAKVYYAYPTQEARRGHTRFIYDSPSPSPKCQWGKKWDGTCRTKPLKKLTYRDENLVSVREVDRYICPKENELDEDTCCEFGVRVSKRTHRRTCRKKPKTRSNDTAPAAF